MAEETVISVSNTDAIPDPLSLEKLRKTTRRDAQRFLTSSFLGSILDVVRTIVIANLLGPYLAGLCTTLLVIPQLAQYLNLGLIEALTVFVPHHTGKGQRDSAESIKNTVLGFTFLISTVSFLSVFLYMALFPKDAPEINIFIILSASLIILWEVKQFFVTHYALEHDFLTLSWVEFCFSLFTCLFQIIGVYLLKGYGFWLGFILANLAVIFYSGRDYLKKNRIQPLRIDFREAMKLIPLGIAMLISTVTYAPFIMTARIFIASVIGVQEVGFFILSTIIIGKISIIPSAIGKVLVPRMSILHAGHGRFDEVYDLFLKSQVYTFLGTATVILASLFLIGPAVTLVLPGYVSGIPAAKMMLVAGIPFSLIDNANNVLFALQMKRAYTKNLAAALGLQGIIFTWMFFTHRVSALGVSTSLFFVFLFYAVLANFRVFRLRNAIHA